MCSGFTLHAREAGAFDFDLERHNPQVYNTAVTKRIMAGLALWQEAEFDREPSVPQGEDASLQDEASNAAATERMVEELMAQAQAIQNFLPRRQNLAPYYNEHGMSTNGIWQDNVANTDTRYALREAEHQARVAILAGKVDQARARPQKPVPYEEVTSSSNSIILSDHPAFKTAAETQDVYEGSVHGPNSALHYEEVRQNPDSTPMLDDPTIKNLLEHPCTAALEIKLGLSPNTITDPLFVHPLPYRAICLPNANGTQKFLTTAEVRHLLYSYIINRASAFGILEVEGYNAFNTHKLRGTYESQTDAAFVHLFKRLVLSDVAQQAGKIIRIKGERTLKALEIVTSQPMKFKAQKLVGKMLQPEEVAVFAFTPSKKQKGAWDTAWEVVSRSYAVCFYGDEKYAF